MDENRKFALRLAHQAANPSWSAEMVVASARVYLGFLEGKRDAEIIDAAREFSEKIRA